MLMEMHDQRLKKAPAQQHLLDVRLIDLFLVTRFDLHRHCHDIASKSDTSLRCPLRQTLPIFKQPVTYHPTQRDEVKPQVTNNSTTANSNTNAGKPSEKTKPRQLFWEKRFQNIRPTDMDGQPFEHFKLPEQIKGKRKRRVV